MDDGLIYAADLNGRLHCLDAATGAVYWIHDTRHQTWGNVLVADGKVYLMTKRSFWILKTGKEKQVLFTCKGGSESSPVAANCVLYAFMKSHLYALAENTTPAGPERIAAPDSQG